MKVSQGRGRNQELGEKKEDRAEEMYPLPAGQMPCKGETRTGSGQAFLWRVPFPVPLPWETQLPLSGPHWFQTITKLLQ